MLIDNIDAFTNWLTMGGESARTLTLWAIMLAWLIGLFLVVTMIRARPKRGLDRALLFREIVIVLILIRSSATVYFQLHPQIWGGLLFILLLAAKICIIVALVREWTMTDEEVDAELEKEADMRLEKRLKQRNILFRLKERLRNG